jgi:hypothetical protein
MTVIYDPLQDNPINMIGILSFNGTFLIGGMKTSKITEIRGD